MKNGTDFLTDKFCKRLILTADPTLEGHVDRLSSTDLRNEAAKLAAMTVEYWSRSQNVATSVPEWDTVRVVPESVLTKFGIPPQEFPYLDTGSRGDSSDPLRKILNWNGIDIGVTHERGRDTRYGRKLIQYSYGHIRGSYGFAEDSKAVDVILGPDLMSANLYRIRQLNESGMLDEHKYGIGWRSPDEFRLAYQTQLPPELRDRMFGGVEVVDISLLQPYRKQELHLDSCECALCQDKKSKKNPKKKTRSLEEIEAEIEREE